MITKEHEEWSSFRCRRTRSRVCGRYPWQTRAGLSARTRDRATASGGQLHQLLSLSIAFPVEGPLESSRFTAPIEVQLPLDCLGDVHLFGQVHVSDPAPF